MKVPIEQVWEYEFKPEDTMRLLHAFKNVWELSGSEITLERRGDRFFAVRREKDCPEDEAFGRNINDGFPSIRRYDD